MRRWIIAALLAGAAALPASAALATTIAKNYPVFFQPWSAAIDANGSSTIKIAARMALSAPTDPVIVTGSSDTVGPSAANSDVSRQRAQAVADALVADGVPRPRIAIVSTGPLPAPGAMASSFAQFSRRVLIQVGN